MAKFYDTLLAEYVKNPGVRGLGLDKLASTKLDYEMLNFDDLVKKQKLNNFSEVDLELASKYSGEDVYITYQIFCEQELSDTENKILEEMDFPFIEVLKNMEITGVKISRDRLKELGIIFENKADKFEKLIYEICGEEFNINSPKQVGGILFDKLGLPKGKKTKTGWSVSAEVLENLAKEFPVADHIIKYRHFTKLNSTFVNGLLDLLDEQDLLHTTYNQAVTATGRLSSTNPNLQNIPSSSGIAGEVRSAFVSRFEGGKIMAIDYSQVELRLLAIMSGDENLLDAFKRGFDIHQRTAELIGTTDRKVAKAVNFGVVYGISGFGLSKMIDITVSDANLYIKKFFESYPKVRIFLDETIKFCEENGYVETLFGRKRFIKGITDRNKMIKSGAEREAINMPIQGTNADIMKVAMIKIDEFMVEKKSKLIMQVHDEVVFDIYPGEEEIIEKEIISIMENVLVDKEITLKVDCEIGENWRDAK
ncbi:MAG: DNA polymerase [Candidatus Gracilibacteria bacterium]|nr:DNA polymerase [Candidatus Gracilibacteria bacterium]MDQ7023437.1 DNA polymerase [Candidatus Gracilibacteria bacterium]